MRPHMALLKSLDACPEARAWAKRQPDLATCWARCSNPDWMLWLLRHLGHDDPQAYRLLACWCIRNTPLADGRKVWDLLTDERSKNAVVLAERFAIGEATQEELAAARAAARAAAWDAAWAAARDAARAAAWDAAWAAAWDAAWAAARDAARAAAWDAAWDAARDAARAAAWDAAGDAAWDAAWDAARAAAWDAARDAQSIRIREVFPYAVVESLVIAYQSAPVAEKESA